MKTTINTKVLQLVALTAVFAGITACNYDGDDALRPYYQAKVAFLFNADPSVGYTFFYNGDTLYQNKENNTFAAQGLFVARNNATGKDEISENIAVDNLPAGAIQLVKFQGMPIQFASKLSEGTDNPADKEHVKCAFFYNNASLPEKLRVYVREAAGSKTIVDTVLVTKGHLSTFSKDIEVATAYNVYLFQKKDEAGADDDDANWKIVPGYLVKKLPVDATGAYKLQAFNIQSLQLISFSFGIPW